MAKDYTCNCALRPNEHKVLITEKRDHLKKAAALAEGMSNLTTTQANTPADNLVDALDSMTLDDPADLTAASTLLNGVPPLTSSLNRTTALKEITRSVRTILTNPSSHSKPVDQDEQRHENKKFAGKVEERHENLLDAIDKKLSDAEQGLTTCVRR
ncbi:hypothetical protein R3P38DRAFT_2797423 [Favolaschia claudopus]|uniref:Uncharacterized protein n=1 Tax=Favolaschia claudopus TaxID=2862362 RepID=A0AAW0A3N5_9AGAR